MDEGRYLYCIIDGGIETSLGGIGIEDSRVFTILHRDISAVVHACPATPYDTKEEDKAREWLLSHLFVIDEATNRYGSTAPFGFDTIIAGSDDRVRSWLADEYPRLRRTLDHVQNRAEYGVQIFWNRELAARRMEETDEEVRGMLEERASKPSGVAFMLKRKANKLVERKLAAEARNLRCDFIDRIAAHAQDVRPERRPRRVHERWSDKPMLMGISCLVHKDRVDPLGETLEGIKAMEGFDVRFTGPWAPFSFMEDGA